MSEKLTAKQQVVYDFIKKELKRNGFAPSVREICDGVGLSSTSTVHAHLESLKKKGYIKRFPSRNRTIEILEEGFFTALKDYSSVPVVKKLTKDEPVLASDNIEGSYLVLSSYVSEGDYFMYPLAKPCDEEGLKPGDYVLVKLQQKTEKGKLMLVFDSGDVAVKKLGSKKDSAISVIGKILALHRWY